MRRLGMSLSVVLVIGLVVGCGTQEAPPANTGPAPVEATASRDSYLLAAEPPGAKGVRAARQEAKDGDDVVVVGRVGGADRPWVEGRAAFWIVDSSFKPCNERDDDACPTPWDYCCDPKEELHQGMATVKVVDGDGRTVATDARQLLGLKELQTVVVKGKARRDGEGNFTVLATGLYVRP